VTEFRRAAPAPAAWIGLALLVALQLWLIIAHAPWRDELQAYLLVRDSPNLPALFANLHYEGHPSLWYLLLSAAQNVVHTPRVLIVVQVAIALATTALVWLRAPFPAWLRLVILAGYFLLFEYGVIARSYGLGVVLLFAWLALRRTPWSWLLLALMANVAVHFALLSAFLVAAAFWIEGRWSRRGVAVWFIGCLLAVLTIIPAHDVQTGSDLLSQPLIMRVIDAVRRQSAILLPTLIGPWRYHWQLLPAAPAGLILGVLAAGVASWSVRREPRASLLAIGLWGALTAMSALLYTTYLRHVGVLLLFVIALEWMRVERDGRPASPVFVGWMSLSAVCGLWVAGWALAIPFAPGREETRWIAAHHLQTAAWAAYPGYNGSDIAADFNRPIYNVQKQCLNSFIRWNAHAYDDVDDDVLADRIAHPGPFAYLVSDQNLAPIHAPLRLIARFDRGLGDNDVFLYAVTRPQSGTARVCP
jgi:hypothetical protein